MFFFLFSLSSCWFRSHVKIASRIVSYGNNTPMCVPWHLLLRYDTIRDAILTCTRKPTWVSLIYRTEPTSKNWEKRQTKKIKYILCSEVLVNSPGNPWIQSWKRKGKAAVEKIYRKGSFKPGMKEWVGDGILIIISMTVGVRPTHAARVPRRLISFIHTNPNILSCHVWHAAYSRFAITSDTGPDFLKTF